MGLIEFGSLYWAHWIGFIESASSSKMARNGSGMDGKHHNLVKTDRDVDASPAVTTGRPQDVEVRTACFCCPLGLVGGSALAVAWRS